eukprot:8743255-Pyramimonas_sp.AAC.1
MAGVVVNRSARLNPSLGSARVAKAFNVLRAGERGHQRGSQTNAANQSVLPNANVSDWFHPSTQQHSTSKST